MTESVVIVRGVNKAEDRMAVAAVAHSFTRRPPIRSATAVERSEGLRNPDALNPRFDPNWKQKKGALKKILIFVSVGIV